MQKYLRNYLTYLIFDPFNLCNFFVLITIIVQKKTDLFIINTDYRQTCTK